MPYTKFFVRTPVGWRHGLLMGLLFLVGYRWAQYTNSRPWITGLAMLASGGVLVAVAIALGG